MIKLCNIESYVFEFETWFLVLRKEYRVGAFNNSVTRKLNSNRDEVMERWMELRNSYFYVFTKLCPYSSERG